MKNFKKFIGKLHLWLGLATGLVVFIVSITGCLYAFQEEIQNATQAYRFVLPENKAVLPPSVLEKIAQQALPHKHLHSIEYGNTNEATKAVFYHFQPSYYYLVYLNPYSGKVLKIKNMDSDFFRIVLNGHYYLWLPPQIGHPLVASATLGFLILLLSGLVLWWPKNQAAAKQRFSIKWNASWKRRNYDLHNVLGFYATWIVLVIAITGLVWGFEWFAKSLYWSIGGQKSLRYEAPLSSKATANLTEPAIDQLWKKIQSEYPKGSSIDVHPAETDSSSILIEINPEKGTYWQRDYRYFDQYTLQEKTVKHIYGRITQASLSDKLFRMNYDIHVGAIFGLAGKILAFFISLIAASLPITGFLIWWGRKRKQSKNIAP